MACIWACKVWISACLEAGNCCEGPIDIVLTFGSVSTGMLVATASTDWLSAPLDIADNLLGMSLDFGRKGVDPASWFCVEVVKDWGRVPLAPDLSFALDMASLDGAEGAPTSNETDFVVACG